MLNAGFIEDTDGVPVLESKLYGTISETSLILVSGGEGQLTVNAYKNHQNVAATVDRKSSGRYER